MAPLEKGIGATAGVVDEAILGVGGCDLSWSACGNAEGREEEVTLMASVVGDNVCPVAPGIPDVTRTNCDKNRLQDTTNMFAWREMFRVTLLLVLLVPVVVVVVLGMLLLAPCCRFR